MQSNIISDIKKGIKSCIEDKIRAVNSTSTGNAGVAPSGKIPSIITSNMKTAPQIMPQIQITMVADTPDTTRGQSYNYRVFYREPDVKIPGVEITVVDEAGNSYTGPYYRMQYIQPQAYIFRYRITVMAECEDECEDIHTQVLSMFEGQRVNRIRVVRNADDEAQYEEYFTVSVINGRHFPFDGELARSVIELDVLAYHDTAFDPVKQYRIQKVNKAGYIVEDIEL